MLNQHITHFSSPYSIIVVSFGKQNNVTLMNDLQGQQSKAAKSILNKSITLSSSDASDSLKWKTLNNRRHAHRCIFIFKCLNNLNSLINFDFELIDIQYKDPSL